MKTFSLLLLAVLSFNASGATDSIRIFLPGTIRQMLGPYPVLGSEASNKDFEVLMDYQRTRTAAECEEAALEESANLVSLFGGPQGPLTKSEAKKLQVRFLSVYAEAGANIYLAKKIYKRPRPYIANKEIKPCIDLEGSYAYPSGHTALARMFARLLSRIYPDRAQAFMDRANDVANNRIIGGVHHPTDIVSGKKFGDALANEVDDRELRAIIR